MKFAGNLTGAKNHQEQTQPSGQHCRTDENAAGYLEPKSEVMSRNPVADGGAGPWRFH